MAFGLGPTQVVALLKAWLSLNLGCHGLDLALFNFAAGLRLSSFCPPLQVSTRQICIGPP